MHTECDLSTPTGMGSTCIVQFPSNHTPYARRSDGNITPHILMHAPITVRCLTTLSVKYTNILTYMHIYIRKE